MALPVAVTAGLSMRALAIGSERWGRRCEDTANEQHRNDDDDDDDDGDGDADDDDGGDDGGDDDNDGDGDEDDGDGEDRTCFSGSLTALGITPRAHLTSRLQSKLHKAHAFFKASHRSRGKASKVDTITSTIIIIITITITISIIIIITSTIIIITIIIIFIIRSRFGSRR